jgi:hypothetical protein
VAAGQYVHVQAESLLRNPALEIGRKEPVFPADNTFIGTSGQFLNSHCYRRVTTVFERGDEPIPVRTVPAGARDEDEGRHQRTVGESSA